MESAAEPKVDKNSSSKNRKRTALALKFVVLVSALVATAGVIMLLYGVYGHRTYNFYGSWYGNEAHIAIHYTDCTEHPVVGPLPASGQPLPIVGGTLTDISTIGSFPQLPGIYSLYILAGWLILYGSIGMHIGMVAWFLFSNLKIGAQLFEYTESETQLSGRERESKSSGRKE